MTNAKDANELAEAWLEKHDNECPGALGYADEYLFGAMTGFKAGWAARDEMAKQVTDV